MKLSCFIRLIIFLMPVFEAYHRLVRFPNGVCLYKFMLRAGATGGEKILQQRSAFLRAGAIYNSRTMMACGLLEKPAAVPHAAALGVARGDHNAFDPSEAERGGA